MQSDISVSDFWFVLCTGKMFKTRDLNMIVEFFLMFHKDKPIDWLLDHILFVKVCNPEKDPVSFPKVSHSSDMPPPSSVVVLYPIARLSWETGDSFWLFLPGNKITCLKFMWKGVQVSETKKSAVCSFMKMLEFLWNVCSPPVEKLSLVACFCKASDLQNSAIPGKYNFNVNHLHLAAAKRHCPWIVLICPLARVTFSTAE